MLLDIGLEEKKKLKLIQTLNPLELKSAVRSNRVKKFLNMPVHPDPFQKYLIPYVQTEQNIRPSSVTLVKNSSEKAFNRTSRNKSSNRLVREYAEPQAIPSCNVLAERQDNSKSAILKKQRRMHPESSKKINYHQNAKVKNLKRSNAIPSQLKRSQKLIQSCVNLGKKIVTSRKISVVMNKSKKQYNRLLTRNEVRFKMPQI